MNKMNEPNDFQNDRSDTASNPLQPQTPNQDAHLSAVGSAQSQTKTDNTAALEATEIVKDEDSMAISEVLSELQEDFPDISISKIRFLESRGLITPGRSPSGYRQFVAQDLEQLRWILTMQRDHFLPLRVIKERIDTGEVDFSEIEPKESTPQPAEQQLNPEPVSGSAILTHFRASGAGAQDHLSLSDFATRAELSNAQVNELIGFGLISVSKTDKGSVIDRSQLRVARAAAICFDHGLEARHLRAWRVAAVREAGLVEQIVAPMLHKGSPEDLEKARTIADALIDQGQVIRESIMVSQLKDRLLPEN